jgi:hypothetical protein
MPQVGDRLVAEIFQRVEVLAEHADIGRIVPEFSQPFLRELIHPPFRLFIAGTRYASASFASGTANGLSRLETSHPLDASASDT